MTAGDVEVLSLKSICGTESPTLTLCGWKGGGGGGGGGGSDFIYQVGSLCSCTHNAFNPCHCES